MKIVLDFDGNLVRLHDKVLEVLKMKYPGKYTAYDCTSWHFWELPKFVELNLTKKDFYKACDIVNKNFMVLLDPYDEDTVSVVNGLAATFGNDSVSVLTAKPKENLHMVVEWLLRHNLGWCRAEAVDKAEMKLDHAWDVLVDDNPQTAVQAWERGCRVVRLETWKEIDSYIRSMDDESPRTYILTSAPWNRFLISERPEIFKSVKHAESQTEVEAGT